MWETKQSPFKLAILAPHRKLKEMSLKEAHESFSSISRGPIHEDRRLQIEELDEWHTMSSSRGKKVTVLASKKRKEVSSSSGPTPEVCHPFLRFPIGPQEELFHILWDRPLIVGRYINWAAVEQIIEPTYLELTMELCSTFHLQTVMMNYDDPGTVQFHLGGLVRQLSVLEFGTALGLYTEEFKEENDLHALNRHIHRSPARC
ncbi:hypothetical protein GOBAR_AA11946 [Gossypium barbadense]|uniref:Uncharacterized protein n=1 Tax=Gossypium barbadense TaxID=3634 RepID=A0A2P5XZD5_GOSBA|nr:hypothetical protein GOBAR_AA11946 [Gossypium barbadense]